MRANTTGRNNLRDNLQKSSCLNDAKSELASQCLEVNSQNSNFDDRFDKGNAN